MSTKCTIQFKNNPSGVYFAGQTIIGETILVTSRPKTIRSIFICISGFSEVRWTENVLKPNNEGKPDKAFETFSAHELYYSSEKFVYGQSGGSQLELPAGKYVYPFEAIIPPNAPTSFNGDFGQIQHEVSLVIDRVMRYNNIFKKPYTVLLPFDLNRDPENAKPLQKIEEKTSCWSLCCNTNGPMVMRVNTPFSAYAPGQKVKINLVLDNQSDSHCYDVKARLVKRVTYCSRSPDAKSKVDEFKIADNHFGEVVKHNKAEFNEYLQIPSTTPSSLESCSIIRICYILKFIAKLSRIHGDLVIDFPINIGTAPLYASLSDCGPINIQPGGGQLNKPFVSTTFEEDAHSQQFESNTYKPRYPVFLNDSTPNSGTNSQNISLLKSPPVPVSPVSQAYPDIPAASSNPIPDNSNSVNVLGFSIPHDYQPTPSAPSAQSGLAKNIGWK